MVSKKKRFKTILEHESLSMWEQLLNCANSWSCLVDLEVYLYMEMFKWDACRLHRLLGKIVVVLCVVLCCETTHCLMLDVCNAHQHKYGASVHAACSREQTLCSFYLHHSTMQSQTDNSDNDATTCVFIHWELRKENEEK